MLLPSINKQIAVRVLKTGQIVCAKANARATTCTQTAGACRLPGNTQAITNANSISCSTTMLNTPGNWCNTVSSLLQTR